MSKDDQLPTHYNKPAFPTAPIDRVHAAISDQSLLGRVVSGFVAKLNAHTIARNTEEIEACTRYTEEVGRLADASLERDRKLARYFYDRDELIANDREQHHHQMELDRRTRTRSLRQCEQDDELQQLRHNAAVSEAKRAADRAKWGHDAFNQSLPHRQERLDNLFRSGALDAEIETLLRDEQRSKIRRGSDTAEPERASAIEQIIELLNQEIELAQANHASDEVMAGLHGFRARLKAILEAEKNRPE